MIYPVTGASQHVALCVNVGRQPPPHYCHFPQEAAPVPAYTIHRFLIDQILVRRLPRSGSLPEPRNIALMHEPMWGARPVAAKRAFAWQTSSTGVRGGRACPPRPVSDGRGHPGGRRDPSLSPAPRCCRHCHGVHRTAPCRQRCRSSSPNLYRSSSQTSAQCKGRAARSSLANIDIARHLH